MSTIARHLQSFAVSVCLLLVIALSIAPSSVGATPEDAVSSVVSILPVWPDRPQGGGGSAPGVAPEGSGVVLRPGIVATAWHVVEPAERIDVRLADGRILPATLVGHDVPSDVAVLSIETEVPPFAIGATPALATPACTIGNAFGLGLSLTCGVISARHVTDVGFNPVEDFIQTDAAANPGVSGGALVDSRGHLIGMVSAIFASKGDTNIGINFAVSTELLVRVVDAILTEGQVRYVEPGWNLDHADRRVLARVAAPVVLGLEPEGTASRAGVLAGDLVVRIGDRRIRTPRDAVAALALIGPSDPPVSVLVDRKGTQLSLHLAFSESLELDDSRPREGSECPHPAPVCEARQAVFPISAFDPLASATRIGPDLLVTNRHAIADHLSAVVHTPQGPVEARVVVSDYAGDLALLEVSDLPTSGAIPAVLATAPSGTLYTVGADVGRQLVRVFDPGDLLLGPPPTAELGRLHVTAEMQPGVSGGALVDAAGRLVGIAVGGGDGRFEAIPVAQVERLLAGRDALDAAAVQRRLGTALAQCVEIIEEARGGRPGPEVIESLEAVCAASANQGQLLSAGRLAGRAGAFDEAIALHAAAVSQTPHSINARLSLLVSLQLGGRFREMIPHARWVLNSVPEDPQALRFGVQAGVWGGDPDLAEDAYRALRNADARQAEAARRFIDNAPPAPPRR